MLIVNIQITELNTNQSKFTTLVCEDSEFSDNLLSNMIYDLRLDASNCISLFKELTEK